MRLGFPGYYWPRTGFSSFIGVFFSRRGVTDAASSFFFSSAVFALTVTVAAFSEPGIMLRPAETMASVGVVAVSGRLLDFGCNIIMWGVLFEETTILNDVCPSLGDAGKSDAKLKFNCLSLCGDMN